MPAHTVETILGVGSDEAMSDGSIKLPKRELVHQDFSLIQVFGFPQHHTALSFSVLDYIDMFVIQQALLSSQQNFTVSDPSLPDNPIVYASNGFVIVE